MRSWLTPPTIAKSLGIDPTKVLTWIKSGELRGIDVSSKAGVGRPRYRVDPADLEVFLARRAAGPTPRAPRRRRKASNITEYF